MGRVEQKRRPLGASCRRREGALADLSFEVEDDTFEVSLVEDLFALRGAQEEGAAADVVDLAGDALGVIVDAADEAVAEELTSIASHVEVVLDVASGLFEVEGAEMIADGDALVERFVRSEAELVGQVGLGEQDEGKWRSGVHLIVEQEAKLVEELRGQEMGFVDDEEDEAALAGEVGEGRAELGEEAGETKGGLDLEGEEDLTVEGGDGEVGIGEVDDGVEVVVEGVGEGTQGGGLAGTDVTGDESGETLLKGESEAALDFAVTARGVKVFAGDGSGEGGQAEAIEIIESGHRFAAPLDRVIRVG